MTSIHSLFDWLLEPIFEKLPRKDRLICKMVCQRWYRVLMESRKFRDDRHIYLKNCVINVNQAPASVFMNAVFPYEILTVGSWVKFESQRDLNQFAEHLGNSVVEVIFDGFFKLRSLFPIINKMPLLKSLTVPHSKVHDLAMDFIRIRENESGLLKLDVLKVNNGGYGETLETLERNLMIIKLFIQKSVEVIIQKVILRENSSIDKLLPIFVAVKVNKLHIETDGRSNEEMEKLLKVADLSCERIKFICSPTQSPYSFLESFSNIHPNVKKFTLNCYCLPPKIELPRLTKLVLTLQMPVQSLKSLESLTNLKKLKVMYENLDNDTDECGFGHDAVHITNLKELDLDSDSEYQWSCAKCSEAFVHSFDNLTKYDGSCKISAATLNLMIYNWKFMKDFLIISETINFDDELFDNLSEPRVALNDLVLHIDEMFLTVDFTTRMIKVLPNLRRIHFYVKKVLHCIPSFQNIIQVIVPVLKQLSVLEFNFPRGFKITLSEIALIVQYLECCGFPVQDLPTLMHTCAKSNRIIQFELIIYHYKKYSKIIIVRLPAKY